MKKILILVLAIFLVGCDRNKTCTFVYEDREEVINGIIDIKDLGDGKVYVKMLDGNEIVEYQTTLPSSVTDWYCKY